MPRLVSKLPHVGTTLFTVITQRAQELGAINLAQGFPDYDPPTRLRELLAEQAHRAHHQYAPMPGLPALREIIASRFEQRYASRFDPGGEIGTPIHRLKWVEIGMVEIGLKSGHPSIAAHRARRKKPARRQCLPLTRD